MIIQGTAVYGVEIDAETRCKHYHSPEDVVALRFACCDRYYPCRQCHDEMASHDAEVWPRARFNETAVLCGACGRLLTPPEYMGSNDQCPACGAAFNPGCRSHHSLYFES